MPKQTINTLKNWFKKGLKPLEAQFADWLDSFWHKDSAIPMGSITDLENTLNGFPSNEAVEALETGKEDKANKGVASGYASLDGSGKVPAGQLPSFVDDVLEFANLAGFPVFGETGKIFVAVDTNLSYRWSGSAYILISSVSSDATETVKGVAEISTQAESEDVSTNPTIANVDHTRIISGRGLRWFWEKSKTISQTISGLWNFTTSPTAPTPATADNTAKVATTAYVQNNIADLATNTVTMNQVFMHQNFI